MFPRKAILGWYQQPRLFRVTIGLDDEWAVAQAGDEQAETFAVAYPGAGLGTALREGGVVGTAGDVAAYVPRLVREWAGSAPDERWRTDSGSLLLIDVSGFARLSERLARKGRIGAEELYDAMSSSFSELLAIAHTTGGELIKFGGDALFLLYTGDAHAQRACASAAGMDDAIRRHGRLETSSGPVRLRMSGGVHSGTIHSFLIGSSHRELLVVGPATTETVLMEAAAEPGEILVSPATAALVGQRVINTRKGPGWTLRRRGRVETREASYDTGDPGGIDLTPYVPAAVRTLLSAGRPEPEHRRVTVAFLKFGDVDSHLAAGAVDDVARRLGGLVSGVQDAAERNGVAFLSTDVDRDGGKIILTAGAPETSGHDEERMLLTLREVVGRDLDLPIRIGVNSGRMFAGDIGVPSRRAYTVMGEQVNLAARVMAHAQPGQILATAGVLERSATTFDVAPVEPFAAKGWRRPVEAWSVGPPIRRRWATERALLPLVDRNPELDAFDTALTAAAHRGEGRVLDVVGEAGIGKTRLVHEFAVRADLRQVEVTCEYAESSTPYYAIRRLLLDVLDLSVDDSTERVTERLLEVVRAELPYLMPWTPLLGIPLHVDLPETEMTAALDERFRASRLSTTVLELLTRRFPGPAMMVFQDVHWMDEASADLMQFLGRQVQDNPWLICVTRRESGTGFVPDEQPLTALMRLEPLDAPATQALAMAATRDSPLPRHRMAALVERSGGNPLFVRELVAAVGAGDIDELPDSVASLVAARIDRLPPRLRTVLRHVSVLGRSFSRDLATAILPDMDADLGPELAEFVDVEDGQVSFRSALIRDAAYEGLPFRRRRTLHARVGDVIEERVRAEGFEEPEVLSFHFFHAQRFAAAWGYSLKAAETAESIYANADAAQFYERALSAARQVDDVQVAEVARVQEALGDVRYRMGAFREAAVAYRAARRMLPGDALHEARLMLKEAEQHGWLNRYSNALRWIRRGLHTLEDDPTTAAARQRAQLMVWHARFCVEEGRYRQAITWGRKAIDTAKAADELEALAHAYKVLDWAYAYQGDIDKAVYSFDALRIYEQLGDLSGQGAILNNMASLANERGEWDAVIGLLGRSLEICDRIGDEMGAAIAEYNMGVLRYEQGRWAEAQTLIGQVLRRARAMGHRSLVAEAQRDLGKVLVQLGDLDRAGDLFEAALAEFEDVGAQQEVIDTLAGQAERCLVRGESEAALDLVARAFDRSAGLAGVKTPLMRRLQGCAQLQLGNTQAARSALQESLQSARQAHADYEVALTLHALLALGRSNGERDLADLQTERADIVSRLDIVELPVALAPERLAAQETAR